MVSDSCLIFSLVVFNLLFSSMMTGVIWLVQLVHYPLFADVSKSSIVKFAEDHQSRISWIVMPLMTLEALVGGALCSFAVGPNMTLWSWIAMGLLAVTWISTALLQVPCHRRLSQGYSEETISFLVRSNWIRTIAWSVRSIIFLMMLLLTFP